MFRRLTERDPGGRFRRTPATMGELQRLAGCELEQLAQVAAPFAEETASLLELRPPEIAAGDAGRHQPREPDSPVAAAARLGRRRDRDPAGLHGPARAGAALGPDRLRLAQHPARRRSDERAGLARRDGTLSAHGGVVAGLGRPLRHRQRRELGHPPGRAGGGGRRALSRQCGGAADAALVHPGRSRLYPGCYRVGRPVRAQGLSAGGSLPNWPTSMPRHPTGARRCRCGPGAARYATGNDESWATRLGGPVAAVDALYRGSVAVQRTRRWSILGVAACILGVIVWVGLSEAQGLSAAAAYPAGRPLCQCTGQSGYPHR